MWVKFQIYKAQPVTVRSWCNRFQSQNASCQCHVSLCLAKQSAYFMRKKGVLTNKHVVGLSEWEGLQLSRPKSQTKEFGQTEGVMTVSVVTHTPSLPHCSSVLGLALFDCFVPRNIFSKGFSDRLMDLAQWLRSYPYKATLGLWSSLFKFVRWLRQL